MRFHAGICFLIAVFGYPALADDPWTGTYQVYSRTADGEYFQATPERTITIRQEDQEFILNKVRDYRLVPRKNQLVPKGERPAPTVQVQTGPGAKVLVLQFSFELMFLVESDVPQRWVMVGEQVNIDDSLFSKLQSPQSVGCLTSDEIPKGLKQTYSRLLRFREGNCNLSRFFLPHAVHFMSTQDVERYGLPANMNVLLTDVFAEEFDPAVTQVTKNDHSYVMKTESSELCWVQTRSDDWRIYRYRDLKEPIWRSEK